MFLYDFNFTICKKMNYWDGSIGSMDELPLELYALLIGDDIELYKVLRQIKFFRNRLTASVIADYMIRFGYRIRIFPEKIEWRYKNVICRIDGEVKSSKGTITHMFKSKPHREDGPAVIEMDGTIRYYEYGQLHNLYGPAVIKADGTKIYSIRGQLHNPDGPAVSKPDGTKMYCTKGQLDRKRGPAVIRSDGPQLYYIDGELLNPDGPAVIMKDGTTRC